jgi:hypothetical protein
LSEAEVAVLGDGFESSVEKILARYGMTLARVPAGAGIPGSWWGEREAGLRGATLYARGDTPVHSVLHEACHYVCMSPGRRAALDTDAGGGYDEESGVCYLQVLLADELPGFGRARMFADMDAWGYSFRLGSARAWFEQDAGDALQWLQCYGLADAGGQPTWRLRQS